MSTHWSDIFTFKPVWIVIRAANALIECHESCFLNLVDWSWKFMIHAIQITCKMCFWVLTYTTTPKYLNLLKELSWQDHSYMIKSRENLINQMVVLSVRRTWQLEKEPDTSLRFTKGKMWNPVHKDNEPPHKLRTNQLQSSLTEMGLSVLITRTWAWAVSVHLRQQHQLPGVARQKSEGRLSEALLPPC